MKISTLALALGTAALLVGCGGGGGGNGGVSSSSISSAGSSSSTGGSSSSSQMSNNAVDARYISGYTVIIDDTKDLSSAYKTIAHIFETDTQVKTAETKDNGDQYVYEGTYSIKNMPGFGNVIETNIIIDDQTSRSDTIFLDENYHVKAEQYANTGITATVLPNDNNGVIIKDNSPSDGGLTVNSVDDVKGYTITTNEAHPGTSGLTMKLSISFKCDGSFDYTTDYAMNGHHTVNTYHGDEIYVDDNHYDSNKIGWYYEDEDDERTADSIETDANNQILKGACWYSTNSDGTCSNDLKVETVTKDTTCN